MPIKLVESTTDLALCFEAIQALRPHLTLASCEALFAQMQTESYRMAYIPEASGQVDAVIGFRTMTMFYTGKIIYIDDLSTLPAARGKGKASALLDFVVDLAQKEGCQAVHLDSGHHRFDAHRLYLQKKFRIASHHFILDFPQK